jgi:hypothetical protein
MHVRLVLFSLFSLWWLSGVASADTALSRSDATRPGRPQAQGLLVEPMEHRLELVAGGTATAPIRIGNHLPKPVNLSVSVVDGVQHGNGVPDLDHPDAGVGAQSCPEWVTVDQAPHQLTPGAEQTLTVQAAPPPTLSGERLCIVLLAMEPTLEAHGEGRIRAATSILLRYAVLLRMTITGARAAALKPALEVRHPRALWRADAEAVEVSVDVANVGLVNATVSGEALVLDADGTRLRERLPLEALYADKRVGRQTIYPFGYVTFSARTTKRLPPGAYPIRVVLRSDGSQRLTAETRATVPDEPSDGASRLARAQLRWEPTQLTVAAAPSTKRLVSARLRNEQEQPVTVRLETDAVTTHCPGWAVATPETVEVPAAGSQGVLVTVEAGPEAIVRCEGTLAATVDGATVPLPLTLTTQLPARAPVVPKGRR